MVSGIQNWNDLCQLHFSMNSKKYFFLIFENYTFGHLQLRFVNLDLLDRYI